MKKWILHAALFNLLFISGHFFIGPFHGKFQPNSEHNYLIELNRQAPLPAQHVSENKFGTIGKISSGVNIHFIEDHEEDLDMIEAAGIKFIRMDFIWETIERSKGIYDWSGYEELTNNLEKRGLKAIYILDYSNPIYEDTVEFKDPITGEVYKGIASPRNPESLQAFANWAAASVNHFRDSNIIWEIWNEPNISFWRPKPNIEQYLDLAKLTVQAIRKAVPGATIIGPATSKIPFPFLEFFMASGILAELDGISVHPYRDYDLPPESASEDFRQLEELIARYTPYDKTKIPIISSEWGYASATKGVSMEKQAAWCVRMQLSNLLSGIPISIWYDWKNDGESPSNFEHNCGTVTSTLEPKPAYLALKTLNCLLKGYVLHGRIELLSNLDYMLVFRNAEGLTRLAVWTTGQTHKIELDDFFQDIEIAEIWDGYGNDLLLKTGKDQLNLELGSMPQYIDLSYK